MDKVTTVKSPAIGRVARCVLKCAEDIRDARMLHRHVTAITGSQARHTARALDRWFTMRSLVACLCAYTGDRHMGDCLDEIERVALSNEDWREQYHRLNAMLMQTLHRSWPARPPEIIRVPTPQAVQIDTDTLIGFLTNDKDATRKIGKVAIQVFVNDGDATVTSVLNQVLNDRRHQIEVDTNDD